MKTKLKRIEHVCGVEYISEKKENKNFVSFLLLLLSLYYIYFMKKTYDLGVLNINEVQILLFFVYLSLFIFHLDSYFVEKLLLINNVGIQIEKNSFFNKSIKFICADDLKNVFIHEVIYIFEICPYLCISLKDNQLIVIFENFSLKMRMLVNVYREIKKMFFFRQVKHLKNIKDLYIKSDNESSFRIGNLFIKEKIKKKKKTDMNINKDAKLYEDDYSSDDKVNIFQMLASTYNEQFKECHEDLEKESKKNIIYEVYLDKKVALEIMN